MVREVLVNVAADAEMGRQQQRRQDQEQQQQPVLETEGVVAEEVVTGLDMNADVIRVVVEGVAASEEAVIRSLSGNSSELEQTPPVTVDALR